MSSYSPNPKLFYDNKFDYSEEVNHFFYTVNVYTLMGRF